MEPDLLLLDEPMAGMTHEEKQDMCRFIRAANAELGTTIVLIEHDIGVVMGLSDRVVVLRGRPGRIAGEIRVDAPHPRSREFRTSDAYTDYCRQASDLLRRAMEDRGEK